MSAAPWSFSRIKAFQQCPKQFYYEKVIKKYPFKPNAATTYGNQFHRAAEKYIRDGEDLDPRFDYARGMLDALNAKKGEKVCEKRMALTDQFQPCRYGSEHAWFRGIADLLIINNEDKLAWVIDYKTSKSARYADKGQLELMALAVFAHYPLIETVRAGLLFVVSEDLIKDRYTLEDETMLWDKWMDSYDSMKAAFDNDVWNPKPSGLCKQWCPVLECPHNGRN